MHTEQQCWGQRGVSSFAVISIYHPILGTGNPLVTCAPKIGSRAKQLGAEVFNPTPTGMNRWEITSRCVGTSRTAVNATDVAVKDLILELGM